MVNSNELNTIMYTNVVQEYNTSIHNTKTHH